MNNFLRSIWEGKIKVHLRGNQLEIGLATLFLGLGGVIGSLFTFKTMDKNISKDCLYDTYLSLWNVNPADPKSKEHLDLIRERIKLTLKEEGIDVP